MSRRELPPLLGPEAAFAALLVMLIVAACLAVVL